MITDEMKFPKLGFGLMRLPKNDDGSIDIPQLNQMVDLYMERGFNYFDTAYMYCSGNSERAVKESIVKRYPRESFTLVSKLPQWMMSDIDDRDRIFNDQLEKTGAGYFDIYFLHSVEDGANYEGYKKYDCFNWAMKKKEEGLIKHFGFSYHGTPELLDEILSEHPEVELVQIQLNYADWNNPLVQSGKLYEVLRKHNIPMIVMEPVKGGSLANVVPEIEEMFKAEKPDASIASWALRFVASLPGVATTLSGMSNTEQMMDNLNTFANFEPLSEKEEKLIVKARKIITESNTIPCTSCRYCTDGCPMKIKIPDIFKALNVHRVYPKDGRPHFYYQGLVDKSVSDPSGKASICIQCGQCESVCPQHLPIISYIAEAAEVFDKED